MAASRSEPDRAPARADRSARPDRPDRAARVARLERGAVLAVTVLALAYAAVALGVGVVDLVARLGASTTTVELLTADGAAGVPGVEGAGGGGAVVEAARFPTAVVSVAGLGSGTVLVLALAHLLGALTHVAVALCAAMLGRALLVGRPFRRAATWSVAGAALALLVGGAASQAVGAAGAFSVVDQLGRLDVFPVAATFSPTPWLVGLGLALVAAAFEVGERLQRDTDGLV